MNHLEKQSAPQSKELYHRKNAISVEDGIYIYGAREHNLKSINVFIPRNKITVVTGLSGSGKSSLVFDTVYAEGQRRYVESLSSYARFFIDNLKKPELETIKGLSPTIAINQRSINSSPRSTVGTVTETYDYLRLLFAKLGTAYCVKHQEVLQKSSVDQIAKQVMKMKSDTRFFVLAPVARGKKGEFTKEFEKFLSAGFTRARVNNQWIDLSTATKLAKRKDHFIDLLIDRLMVKPSLFDRLRKSLQQAAEQTDGFIKIELMDSSSKSSVKNYSIHNTCPVCAEGFPELEPKLFSFNNPKGACSNCHGLGYLLDDDVDMDFEEMEEEDSQICPACQGTRLNPFALNVKIKNKNIAELSAMSLEDLSQFCSRLRFPSKYKIVADKILEKINTDLNFLNKTGLSYLSMNRPIRSLSGGEAQRIRLMSQLSSPLIGILYVLDEPSQGLHPKDHARLLNILYDIRNRGNTVLMVEHDEKTIRSADYLIDLGPGAGTQGGKVVGVGSVKKITNSPESLTGVYLSGKKTISVPQQRNSGTGKYLEIVGAKGNNLKNINLRIPLGCLVGVTGVSGSGKSTLIMDTLYKALKNHFYQDSSFFPAPYKEIKGLDFLDKVIAVNQKPIGRTPRSIPATYVGIMSVIRAFNGSTSFVASSWLQAWRF